MQKLLASVGWLELEICFYFLHPWKEWVSKDHFFKPLVDSKQPGCIHYMLSVIKVTRTWQIADESLLTYVASIHGATHSDASRLSPLGSEGSPRTQECWRGVPEFPPRPRRSPDATEDGADSLGAVGVAARSHDRKSEWKQKRLGDQKHTSTQTYERGGTAHTFPAIQLPDCHRGSALPAGCA